MWQLKVGSEQDYTACTYLKKGSELFKSTAGYKLKDSLHSLQISECCIDEESSLELMFSLSHWSNLVT